MDNKDKETTVDEEQLSDLKEVVIELTRTETQKIIEKDKETLLKAGGDDCLNEKDNIKQLSLNRKLYFTAQFFLPRILFICGGLYIIYYK